MLISARAALECFVIIPPMSKSPHIQTVLGPIRPDELGFTLTHEHFFCGSAAANFAEPENPAERALSRVPVTPENRQWVEYHFHANADNLVLDDMETAVSEAMYYKRAGGCGFIDVTPIGVNRNPRGLVEVAKRTGLQIVMGCGVYTQLTHPPEIAGMSRQQLAQQIIDEFAHGVDDTGVKPGIIGEIGISWPMTPDEEKCLLAGCDAQVVLGAAMQIHPGKHPDSIDQIIGVLRKTRVDLSRVIMCHMERTLQDIPRITEMLRTGIIAEYDLFGREVTSWYYRRNGIDMLSDAQRLEHFRRLIDAGFIAQLLMSHDISFKHMLHKYGGNGYDYILTNTVPWMKLKGFTQREIDTITIDNPARLMTLPVRG